MFQRSSMFLDVVWTQPPLFHPKMDFFRSQSYEEDLLCTFAGWSWYFFVCTTRSQRHMTYMFDLQILRELAASTLSRGNPFWMSCCQRASSNWRSLHDAMSLLRCKKQGFCDSKRELTSNLIIHTVPTYQQV